MNIGFEKISQKQAGKDAALFSGTTLSDFDPEEILKQVALPTRATAGSAGYDFVSPIDVELVPGRERIIPTGVRCLMPRGLFLMMVPRSGLAFRHGFRLVNTVGIVDSDYSEAENEGHILLKVVVDRPLTIHAGDRIAQGILIPYGVTTDDAVKSRRKGGFGSTGRA